MLFDISITNSRCLQTVAGFVYLTYWKVTNTWCADQVFSSKEQIWTEKQPFLVVILL